MMTPLPSVSRRLLLAGLAVMALGAPAQAAPLAIRIDLSQIEKLGGVSPQLRGILQAEYGKAFAGSAHGAGTAVVVRVKSVYFSGGGGGRGRGSWRGDGGGDTDYLDADVHLVGARGQILASYSILSPVPVSGVMAQSSAPDQERLRLMALARHSAGWARRYILG